VRYVPASASAVTLAVRTGSDAEAIVAQVILSPEFRARYRLGRVLGSGGMAIVVLAADQVSGHSVAVKIHTRMAHAEHSARFQREARLLMAIRHPHVVEVTALEEMGGHPILVMEHLSGGTLRERLGARGRLSPPEAVALALELLEGLRALHERGVVHRDLKPENLLFDAAGVLKISDLGIAKDYGDVGMTAAGQIIGTPAYMSPEQARGEPCVVASDIYAAGVILYEMLAGAPPFPSRSPMELLRLHATAEPPPLATLAPGVPVRLAAPVMRALAKRADDRPATAEILATALRRAMDLPAAPIAPPRRTAGAPGPTPAGLVPARPQQPEHAWLVVDVPEYQEFPLGQRAKLGRAVDADIQFHDDQVSRQHAEIVREGGSWFLVDCGSRNGVTVNRRRVHDRQLLADGDRITLGETSLRFVTEVGGKSRRVADIPVPPPLPDPARLRSRRMAARSRQEARTASCGCRPDLVGGRPANVRRLTTGAAPRAPGSRRASIDLSRRPCPAPKTSGRTRRNGTGPRDGSPEGAVRPGGRSRRGWTARPARTGPGPSRGASCSGRGNTPASGQGTGTDRVRRGPASGAADLAPPRHGARRSAGNRSSSACGAASS
jgi:serine/threonine-protein kinase